MADKEIKSTLEIAMEKVAKLPRLTPEQIQEQRERALEPRGRAIAGRCLDGTLQPAELVAEVAGLGDDDRDVVRKIVRSKLCDAIDLDRPDQGHRAIRALRELERGTALEGKVRELEELVAEQLGRMERTLAGFEEAGRDRLSQLGISGSAIRLNPDSSEDLQGRVNEVRQAFTGRLEQLRRELH